MAPTTSTVLAWRWGVGTLVRVGAGAVIAWTLWTYVPILIEQLIVLPMRGGTPFAWLDESQAWVDSVTEWRQEFYSNLRLDAGVLSLSVAAWALSGRIAVLLVRFPRALVRCPACMYSLESLEAARCPECGLDLPESMVRVAGGGASSGADAAGADGSRA